MLKKVTTILILIVLFPLSAQGSDSWTQNEIIKQGIYGLVTVIDAKQTQQGIQGGNYREANPFMGEHPSSEEINQHLLSVFIIHTLMANYFSTENRKILQDVTLILGVTNISRNHMLGVKINF